MDSVILGKEIVIGETAIMFGILYLILAFLLGKEIVGVLLPNRKGADGAAVSEIWVVLPASFGVGTLFMTWAVYVVSWIASVCMGSKSPLLPGNLVVMSAALLAAAAIYTKRWHRREDTTERRRFIKGRFEVREAVFFGSLLIFVTWIMFYVFHMKNGYLYSGFSVYGDYAPHTAMMRSFSYGNNFPTQYPHFGGEDVKYHFMFQFLAGNLEYLGMRIDFAYNSVSILSLLGFFMMLYALAKRLTGSFAGGVLSVAFMVFRSGTAFFRFVWEHIQAGDLWSTLAENTSFIGYTTNENWGLWNFNVYLNQRHLAFGLILVALAIWIFLEWVNRYSPRGKRSGVVPGSYFFKGGLEKPEHGMRSSDGHDPGALFLLEWGGSNRWAFDFDGICCFFRWKTGLSAFGSCNRGIFAASDKNLYPGGGCETIPVFWVPGRGQDGDGCFGLSV